MPEAAQTSLQLKTAAILGVMEQGTTFLSSLLDTSLGTLETGILMMVTIGNSVLGLGDSLINAFDSLMDSRQWGYKRTQE